MQSLTFDRLIINMGLKRNKVFIVFVIGFLLRVGLMFFNFSFDVNNHISWSHDLWRRGFAGFYETQSKEVYGTFYPNYPPLSIFSFFLSYLLYRWIPNLIWFLNVNIPAFPSNLVHLINAREFLAGMMKFPGIFSDLGVAYVCYLFAKKLFPKNPSAHFLSLVFILFNPAFIYNSSLWGQIDPLAIFLSLLAFYLLIFKKRPVLSAVFFVLAVLVKPTVIIGLPFFGYFLVKEHGLNQIIKSFIIGNLVFIAMFLPFYKSGNLFLFPYIKYASMIVTGQSQDTVSVSAFNIWSIIPGLEKIKDSALILNFLAYRLLGQLILLIVFGLIFYRFIKSKNKSLSGLLLIYLTYTAAFLFLTRMHERYIVFGLPFLAINALNDKTKIKIFLIASLISFSNLYYSWAAISVESLIKIIRNPWFVSVLSIINLLIFIYVFYGTKTVFQKLKRK